MQGINQHNYYMGTTANWTPTSRPNRKPDYTSRSNSDYWYTRDGVIRYSDHWGGEIASCNWYLNDVGQSSFNDRDGWRFGYAKWEDFTFGDYDVTVYDYSNTLDFDKLGKPIHKGVASPGGIEYATYKITPDMLRDGTVHIGELSTWFDHRMLMCVEG